MTDYTKLIHDYLAGELSREDEAQLFDGLSRHAEWREEMQLQLQMERAMEQDLHSVAIPSQTAGAVFASLGFRRPSKWSQYVPTRSQLAGWTVRRIAVTGISGILLFGAGYFALRFIPQETHKAIAGSYAAGDARPTLDQPQQPTRSMHGSRLTSATDNIHGSQIPRTIPQTNPLANPMRAAAVPNSSDTASALPSYGPNEPLRYYSDVGNLYSVYYFTPSNIIGVSYDGRIFMSEDSGHTWAPKRSGVSCDLYGIHFYDRLHGLAVGAQGTILNTSDAGSSWYIVPSGTPVTLSTVRFVTPDTAYICGDGGVMLKSTNGGLSWELLSTGVRTNLFRMAFTNGREGDVYGSSNVHLATTDGGKTWHTIQ